MSFFFLNDTATTEIYTLSLHDALPIWATVLDLQRSMDAHRLSSAALTAFYLDRIRTLNPKLHAVIETNPEDRKSTRLNSSHLVISYAVFCLKKINVLNALHIIYHWHIH